MNGRRLPARSRSVPTFRCVITGYPETSSNWRGIVLTPSKSEPTPT